MKKIRFWFENNALAWGILKHVLVALVLAALVIVVNEAALSQRESLSDLLFSSSGQAESLLSTLAGTMLTVTIFLYSTTVVVLTMYSSQFTPRVIENFSNSGLLSRVLGVFIGGTIYCMLLIFLANNVSGEITMLVPFVGVGYALVGIIRFITFIVAVSKSVQVQNLLSTLNFQAEQAIHAFVESRKGKEQSDPFDIGDYQHLYQIRAKENGFFEDNDVEMIASLLHGREYTIVLYPRVGDFISINEHIADLHYNGDSLSEGIARRLHAVLILEERRYIDNDYRFIIQKIVEIALKGLSPGINDPNTAIYCLRHLGVLAGRLAQTEGEYTQIGMKRSADENSKIIDRDFSFQQDIRDIFVQIIHYGKGDLYVVAAVLDALYTALLVASEGNKEAILAMVDYVFDEAACLHQNPIEQNYLSEKRELFASA